MTPLVQMREPDRIRGLLFDIDETLSTEGKLTATAYGAMERLKRAGRLVVPITGRPAGWCDHIARMWPVDAVVGENGAFYFKYEHARRRMIRIFDRDDNQRAKDRQRLQTAYASLKQRLPELTLASDQAFRISDLAIDVCEDIPTLPQDTVLAVLEQLRAAGLSAKLSSIHINTWVGDFDKLSMASRLLTNEFRLELAADQGKLAYIGDSPNDEPMFRAFELSVGVRNVTAFAHSMQHLPKYVTTLSSGFGFQEFAERLVRARSA